MYSLEPLALPFPSSPYPTPPEDTCYFPDTAELREYVLNSSGKIWVGTASSNYGRPWQFGQFSYHSLEAALELLGKMRYRDRSDPVKVRRRGGRRRGGEEGGMG